MDIERWLTVRRTPKKRAVDRKKRTPEEGVLLDGGKKSAVGKGGFLQKGRKKCQRDAIENPKRGDSSPIL